MASKFSVSLAVFLTLNLLFFNLIAACGGGRGGGGGGGGGTPYTPKPSPCSRPTPTPSPTPPSPGGEAKCPRDTLKLAACANVLNGLINATVAQPPKEPCCSFIEGLVDLEVAVCLCTAIKANILGININLPIDLSLLVNYCGKNVPKGFQCP